jgi:hypothetical protein
MPKSWSEPDYPYWVLIFVGEGGEQNYYGETEHGDPHDMYLEAKGWLLETVRNPFLDDAKRDSEVKIPLLEEDTEQLERIGTLIHEYDAIPAAIEEWNDFVERKWIQGRWSLYKILPWHVPGRGAGEEWGR